VINQGYNCSGIPSICDNFCGNGLLHPNEFCDDNNTNSTDGCASCSITPGYQCTRTTILTPDVCITVCGNGYKTSNEECDDNNN